ncbi:5-methyltetrahydropteroyltriglutamate--homocysteine methyltransferase (EC [Olavius algarvensis Delta 1 endosymbiont]|nr:5-methyltetrahydropteroyltriglutamate--homocysteine methyltransferase (EC [Olavius algarvensis Delta 1 endosymbiont]
MPIQTTTIGAYPKPDYVPVPDWFREESTVAKDPTRALDDCIECHDPQVGEVLDRATREVVLEQDQLGIDVPTDGEIRRENYIHYHCRNLTGIDFAGLTQKAMRDSQWTVAVPTITGPVKAGDAFLVRDWQVAQGVTGKPVKITLPGPLTIIDSTYNAFYDDDRKLAADLASAINIEVCNLARAGCRWIQIDEPIFAREPENALAFGIENLERCFFGIPDNVQRTIHICCGYPDRLDSEDYQKAPPQNYFHLAPALDEAALDAISIEDAHRPNDLGLLELFKHRTVILGVIGIARSRIETVAEIVTRLRQALDHIDKERLAAAPDCGLGMLDRRQVQAKLANMVEAAKLV